MSINLYFRKDQCKSLPKFAASPDLEVNRRTFKLSLKGKNLSLCVEEIMNFL